MKKLIISLLLLVCLLVPISCAEAAPREEQLSVSGPEIEEAAAKREPAPVIEEAVMPTVMPMSEVGQDWATERMIVRTAEIALVVNDVAIALDRVTDLAENLGGYVVSSKRWKEEERLAGIITIRVPAEDFGDAMEALRKLAVDVTHEDTSSKDVTEEYVDLSAKLKNLEATEEQYLRLMEKAEEAKKVEAFEVNLQGEPPYTMTAAPSAKGSVFIYFENAPKTIMLCDIALDGFSYMDTGESWSIILEDVPFAFDVAPTN